jgi:hypothetical protein
MIPGWQVRPNAGNQLDILFELPLQDIERWNDVAGAIAGSLSRQIDAMLRGLGLCRSAALRARQVPASSRFRIYLHNVECRYPTALVSQVWRVRLGKDLPAAGGLSVALASRLAAEAAQDRGSVIAFLVDLILETLKLRPERLLGQADVRAMADRISLAQPLPAEATTRIGEAMGQLLALGRSCDLPPDLLPLMTQIATTDDARDLIEQLITATGDRSIELRVARDDLEDLLERYVDGPLCLDESGTIGPTMDCGIRLWMHETYGIRLPPMHFVADDELPPGTARVRVGALAGAAMRLPALGGKSPDGTANDLAGAMARALQVVRIRLITLASVEFELALLDTTVGRLVRAALRTVTIAELVRHVRLLVLENLSFRNLRAILERLVAFAPAPAPVRGAVNYDDRLLLDDRIPPERRDTEIDRHQFVRYSLGREILRDFASEDTGCLAIAFDLDVRIADHLAVLASNTASLLTDAEIDRLRDVLTDAVEESGASAVFTAAGNRWWLQDLLRDSLPDVPILAFEETGTGLPTGNVAWLDARVLRPKPLPEPAAVAAAPNSDPPA